MKDVCVVTGGTGGIGRAAVREMAKTYQVLFGDINQEKIDAFTAELRSEGLEATGMVCDVSDRAQCDRFAQKAASMGKVVGVIHLAGLTPTFAAYNDIVKVDCLGTMNINEAFFQVMEGGCIMDICSCVAHFRPKDQYPTQVFQLALTDKQAFYEAMCQMVAAAAKGNDRMASNIAYMMGRCFVYWYSKKATYAFGRKKGIRINTVSIGFVETPMSRADLEVGGADYDARLAPWMSFSAFGRPGKVEEVAFLFSTIIDPRNSYLSGCDIYFDNGCEASGYHGQQGVFYDPAVNPYDPEA